MLISGEETEAFRKGSKSEADATKEDLELLKEQLFSIINQTEEDFRSGLFKSCTAYTVSTKSKLTTIEEALEFNNFHEGIHLGYILAMKKHI